MKTPPAILLLLSVSACGGGGDAEFSPPRVVPSEKRPMLWGAETKDRLGVPSMASAAKPSAGSGAPTGETPAGWESLPANPKRFRNAVWRVLGEPDTDCYLTVGVGGGVAFNLKRWYEQQFGKARTPDVETLEEIPFAGQRGRLVELEGAMGQKQGWAALIAFFAEGQQVTSLKFTGPAAIVSAQRAAFLGLARSIRLDGGKATGAAPAIEPGQPLPADHQPISAPATEAAFTADAPEGWTAKQGSRRELHHTFGSGSELYVSQLGGALRQTLDIWRFELQLEAMSDEEFAALPKALFLGDDAVLMDLSGDWRGMTGAQVEDARVLVAARLDGDTITFCKLVGPSAEVGAQRDAFVRFCGSVRRR